MKDPLRHKLSYSNNEIPEGVSRTPKKRFIQVAAGVALTAFMTTAFANPSFAIMSQMEKFELGQSIDLDGVKLTMDRVLFSPLNSTLVFSIDKNDLPEDQKDIKGLRTVHFWKVLDDQGNEFTFKGSNGGINSPDNKDVIVYQMDFNGVENIPESLTVIPQEYDEGGTLQDIEGLQFTIPLQ